jgi:hypothetical protein
MRDPFKQKTPAKAVSRLVDSRTLPIAQLLTVAKRLALVEECLVARLGSGFRGKIRCGGMENGKLVLLASNAAIASSLRMQSQELVAFLKDEGVGEVNEITVRTAPLPQFQPG